MRHSPIIIVALAGILAFAPLASAVAPESFEKENPVRVWWDHCYLYVSVKNTADAYVYYNPLGCWP